MNREEFQKELHKMRQMNARDRLWYLGAYYKVPILIGLKEAARTPDPKFRKPPFFNFPLTKAGRYSTIAVEVI